MTLPLIAPDIARFHPRQPHADACSAKEGTAVEAMVTHESLPGIEVTRFAMHPVMKAVRLGKGSSFLTRWLERQEGDQKDLRELGVTHR